MSTLLLLGFLFQDKSAEETFQKIEEVLEKAKSLSCQVHIGRIGVITNGGEADQITHASGYFAAKEGNKVMFRMTTLQGHQSSQWGLVSDGESMYRLLKVESSPPRLAQVLKRSITRGGMIETLTFSALRNLNSSRENQVEGMSTQVEVSEFSRIVDDEEKTTRTMSYKVKIAKSSVIQNVQVWYNPKDYHLLRVRNTGGSSPETYEKFSFDEAIPDEKFKISEKER